MDLVRLLREGDVHDDVSRATDELIAVKSRTRELGAGAPPAVLDRFVTDQLDAAEHFDDAPAERDARTVRGIADAYFRGEVDRT